MKVTTKTQYFLDGVQVVRGGRALAKELGVSETVVRTWTTENYHFPAPIHSEVGHGGGTIHYYPYYPAMAIITKKMEAYAINRAKGIGRPKKGGE